MERDIATRMDLSYRLRRAIAGAAEARGATLFDADVRVAEDGQVSAHVRTGEYDGEIIKEVGPVRRITPDFDWEQANNAAYIEGVAAGILDAAMESD